MTLTRRDLLKIAVAALVADFQVQLTDAVEPDRPFRGICSWARGVKQAIDEKKFTLGDLRTAVSDLLTPAELGKRLRLTRLPLWCQHEVDEGLMPLNKACVLTQADCPEALWLKAKTMTTYEIYQAIKQQRIMG